MSSARSSGAPGGVTSNPLVAIVGPTASGKSSLGVWLAERLNGEILACDSTQVYRGFGIGTAKPGLAERREIAHHLIDLLEPHEICTAGEYRKRAIGVLQEIERRGRLPIMTVGTGLYLRALLEGLADAPLRSEDLRKRLLRRAERNKPGHLHRLLARMDPAAAERIGPHDTPKLVRAIEVCILAGRPITEVHRSGRESLPGFRPIKIGLNPPRTALYERIERRTVEMIENGWIEEVKALVAHGAAKDAKPLLFIGYRELLEHLDGKRTLPSAISEIQQATRRYAKRQLTWFRKESGVQWFEGFGDDTAVAQSALRYLQAELGKANSSGAVREQSSSEVA
ncbi:MAG TPA: tRNA (adenosine(37)-N6)-dimethylallyltransferase MiaA [Candidatus Acidoferrales bacterium]|nr:tRNA (adenosine(37)-N6)-dimethylallyltransferase MiaA [Candidatus Acidoferrales bacterium]